MIKVAMSDSNSSSSIEVNNEYLPAYDIVDKLVTPLLLSFGYEHDAILRAYRCVSAEVDNV